jgi:hypothetical protein
MEGTFGETRHAYRTLVGKCQERDHMRNISLTRRTVLQEILEK